jgi:hypothetical protein
MNRKHRADLMVILIVALHTSPVAAQTDATATASPDENEEDGRTVIDLSGLTDAVNDLVNEIQDFTGDWDNTLAEVLTAVLFEPFRTLVQQLLEALSLVLMHTPDIYPNPAVEEVHSQVLLITYLLSGLGFMAVGLLYITGPLLGVSYAEVKMILPRMLAALIFSTASLPLLQYSVDLSNALVTAFAPSQLTMSITQLAGFSTAIILAVVIESAVLLVVVAMFVIRDVYLLFVAAISPLLAFAWSLPKAKRYADTFIAGWWTALAMAPLDMLVLKFSFTMLEGNGASLPSSISNWILGVASFTLLILVPYQLYGASQAAIGQAYIISNGVKNRAKQAYHRQQNNLADNEFTLNDDERNRLKAYRRRTRGQSEDGFRSNWGDDEE